MWYSTRVETFRFTATIEKKDTEQRRFWGKAYIHTTADGSVTDASGDVIDTPATQAALEASFYEYVKSSRSGDVGHELFDAATMIEGFVVTKEKKANGFFSDDMDEGIYIGFEAERNDKGDVLWDGIKDGTRTALSIVGEGVYVDA